MCSLRWLDNESSFNFVQLETKLATAEADKAHATATSDRECQVAVAAAAAARERAAAAEAEMEELRAAMKRSISGACEETLGALHNAGGRLAAPLFQFYCYSSHLAIKSCTFLSPVPRHELLGALHSASVHSRPTPQPPLDPNRDNLTAAAARHFAEAEVLCKDNCWRASGLACPRSSREYYNLSEQRETPRVPRSKWASGPGERPLGMPGAEGDMKEVAIIPIADLCC